MIQNKHRFIHTKEVAFTFLLDKSLNVSAILGFKDLIGFPCKRFCKSINKL